MARGKLGGTKAAIRGKVGSQIYQLKRDGNGALVQSVYSAPEQRAYSNTDAQAKNRMIMGQIERMFHILPDIIYDAFAHVASGQQSFNYFAMLNYPLLKSDVENNWLYNSDFDYRPKRDLTAPAGIWKLTDGTLNEVRPFAYSSLLDVNNYVIAQWQYSKANPTLADFYKCIGINATDELNVLFYERYSDDFKPFINRVTIKRKKSVPQTTLVPDSWDRSFFVVEGDFYVRLRYNVSGALFMLMVGGNVLSRDYILDCFGFLNVRRKKNAVLFSPCNFQWVAGSGSTLYGRLTPSQSFETWQQE